MKLDAAIIEKGQNNDGVITKYGEWGQLGIYLVMAIASVSVFSLLSLVIVKVGFDIDVTKGMGWMNSLSDPKMLSAMKVMQFFNAVGLFIIPSILFAFLISKRKLMYFRLNNVPPFLSIFLVAVVMLSAAPLINWFSELNQSMQLPAFLSGMEQWMKEAEEQAKVMTEAFLVMNGITDLIINMIIIALVAAVGEELMFRGIIQKLFTGITKNYHWGIWISAILFSAMHGQFYGFLPRMLMGAMFGYILQWSGSLWLPMLAHFVNNGTAVFISYLIGKGMVSADIDSVGSSSDDLLLVVGSFIIVSGILFLFWKNKKTEVLLDH